MRKFLVACSFALCSFSAGAQILMGILAGSPVSYDSAATALFAAMSPAPSTAYKACINASIVDLKAKSIWTVLGRLWVLASPDDIASSNNALIDWKTTTDILTASGTVTWTTKVGIAGNGSTGILTGATNYDSITEFTQNAAHIALWSLSSAQSDRGDMGYSGGWAIRLDVRYTDDTVLWNVNENATAAVANTDGIGMWITNRSGASAIQLFNNPANMTPRNTDTSASSGVPGSVAPTIFKSNAEFSNRQLFMASIGGNLNTGNLAVDFYNNMNTLKSCIGAL